MTHRMFWFLAGFSGGMFAVGAAAVWGVTRRGF